VPALRELMQTGELASTPVTTLVDEPVGDDWRP
jgi:hypothetical protein